MTNITKSALRVLDSISSIIIVAVMFYVYESFHHYDWDHPYIKFFCFAIVSVLIIYLKAARGKPAPFSALTLMELLIVVFVLAGTLVDYGQNYGPGIFNPPYVDIGYTTVNAASLMVNEGKSPYSSHDINPRDELPPEYRGFHYGPLMLFAYMPGVYFRSMGFKIASVIYLLLSALLMCALIDSKDRPFIERLAGAAFVLCLFFMPERFWWEMLSQGANDMFPVFLGLASLFMLKNEKYLWTGVFAGLSFSAKGSPAAFLIIPFLRRDFKAGFFKGIAAGLFPLLAFFAWDPRGVLNNVFLARATLKFDSTSLYSVTPANLHFMFPLILVAAILGSMAINFKKKLGYENVLITYTLLTVVAEVTFKEVHGNHLIWFYPLFAIILAQYRYKLFRPVKTKLAQ